MAFRISTILRKSSALQPIYRNRSYFDGIFNKCKEDVIFKTVTAFNKDQSSKKVNLSIGIYADENGLLPPVSSRYLPLSGDPEFLSASERFVFGDGVPGMYKFQTCGGTGALSLAKDILNLNRRYKPNYAIPLPTWPNHTEIFKGTNILEKYQVSIQPSPFFIQKVKVENN